MKKYAIVLILSLSVLLCACQKEQAPMQPPLPIEQIDQNVDVAPQVTQTEDKTENVSLQDLSPISETGVFIRPEYDGRPIVMINNDQPFFTEEEKKRTDAFESYSSLDALGRCGEAFANICTELMPTQERGKIGHIKPSGWHTVKYPDIIEDLYLYNRCHLIGFQLAGENDNEKNLITGTRYLNVSLMLPYENQIADYVKHTSNHVLYRVTPVFVDDELVCRGLLMEGWSVEDNGDGICFCCFQHNIQPGITINYLTGDSMPDKDASSKGQNMITDTKPDADQGDDLAKETEDISSDKPTGIREYVLNTNSMKFHLPTCSGVEKMLENNKEVVEATREAVMDEGYKPCGICNP